MEKDYVLHNYLNGTAAQAEIAQLQADPEYASYIKIAEATTSFYTPAFDEKATFDAISEKLEQKPTVKKLNPWTTVLKIAAVFAVIVAGYLYFDSLSTTFSTSVAEKQHFNLPDGSEVALNANSTIDYHKNKWNDNRTLDLNGEAYFRVTKGNTFTVETKTGAITVLGTQFNVFARDNKLNVNCYEGLVSVAFNDTLIKLPAGESLQIKNGILVTERQSITKTPSWIHNESSFENATLETVLNELKRQYPITVNVSNNLKNKRFSGSFTHNDLDLALQLICAPLNLTYTTEEDQVTIYANQNK